MFKLPHAQVIAMAKRGELPATHKDVQLALSTRRSLKILLFLPTLLSAAGAFVWRLAMADPGKGWGILSFLLIAGAICTLGPFLGYPVYEGESDLKGTAKARPPVLEFLEISLEDFLKLSTSEQEALAYTKLKTLAELKDRLQRELAEEDPQTIEVTAKLRSTYDLFASLGLIKNSGYGQFFRKPQA